MKEVFVVLIILVIAEALKQLSGNVASGVFLGIMVAVGVVYWFVFKTYDD